VRWAVVITLTLLIVFGVVFVLEFVAASERPATPEALTADSYMAEVNRLLANADTQRGEALIQEKYECHVCHIQGAGKIAPDFAGIALRAETTHSPLQPAAYIYESIVYPKAHQIEGFSGAMPINYGSRLSEQELGDMIAYLLTQ
jgi:hypothetical protein